MGCDERLVLSSVVNLVRMWSDVDDSISRTDSTLIRNLMIGSASFLALTLIRSISSLARKLGKRPINSNVVLRDPHAEK